jgi:hypothetical protein
MDIETLVDRILSKNKLNDVNKVLDKATKELLLSYFSDCHKYVKHIDKNIIDKLTFIMSNPKFKHWIDKTAYDSSDKKYVWISIVNPGTIYEIKYDVLEVPLKKYEGWRIELDYNSMTTPLDWLAAKAYLDDKHYGSLLYQIKDLTYNITEEQEALKNLFFACLDLSLEKLYDENSYSKITLC